MKRTYVMIRVTRRQLYDAQEALAVHPHYAPFQMALTKRGARFVVIDTRAYDGKLICRTEDAKTSGLA